jgi:hypothetical protein
MTSGLVTIPPVIRRLFNVLAGMMLLLSAGCVTSIKVINQATNTPVRGISVKHYQEVVNLRNTYDAIMLMGTREEVVETSVTDENGIARFHGNDDGAYLIDGENAILRNESGEWYFGSKSAARDGDAYILPIESNLNSSAQERKPPT